MYLVFFEIYLVFFKMYLGTLLQKRSEVKKVAGKDKWHYSCQKIIVSFAILTGYSSDELCIHSRKWHFFSLGADSIFFRTNHGIHSNLCYNKQFGIGLRDFPEFWTCTRRPEINVTYTFYQHKCYSLVRGGLQLGLLLSSLGNGKIHW